MGQQKRRGGILDLKPDYLITLGIFYLFVGFTFAYAPHRQRALRRTWREWVLDLVGLTVHGVVVPAFQTLVLFVILKNLFPSIQGTVELPNWAGFLIAFFAVDYLYYWNHRLLHSPFFWRWHSLHHSSQTMDVFATSRNSWLTSFLIVYVWVNGIGLFLLHNKEGYILGVMLSNILDLFRHSALPLWPRWLPWIISPRDHAWHHSTDTYGINFSGNLSLWDRLHGTYKPSEKYPDGYGFALEDKKLHSYFWRGFE